MDTILQVWQWLESQGLAGDIVQSVVGVVTGVPFVGGLIAGIIGIFKPSAAYKLGRVWGLALSKWMRKLPGIGKAWELFEDRLLGSVADLFKGISDGANEDDKK